MSHGIVIRMKRTAERADGWDYEYWIEGSEDDLGLIRLGRDGTTEVLQRIARDLPGDVRTHLAAGKLRSLLRRGELTEACFGMW